MTAEIITVSSSKWEPGESFEEYSRRAVSRTTDPQVVAEHIVNRGEELATPELPIDRPKIVLLDSDDEPMWWLDIAQALAVADRIRELVRDVLDGRPLRRPVSVDEKFMEMDQ